MTKIYNILVVFLFLISSSVFAGGPATHNIGTGNWNTCSGTLYDTGGSGGNYSNSETITETYCSNVAGDCIEITFTSFSTESCCDRLRIYNGPTTASPLIGTYAGTTSPGTVTSNTGCLTFEWTSDGSIVAAGWEATIACVACPLPTCSDGIQNQGETGIDCGGPCPPCSLNHNIGTGNWNTCVGNFYDTGGSTGDYSNSENITETYCSDVAGTCIEFNFSAFSSESCCDRLRIYDGPNNTFPLIGTYAGTTSPGTVTSTTGCLTFTWTSDGSVINSGWAAAVSCVACPTCTDGIQNGTETGIDCGGTMCPPCPCGDITVPALPYTNTGINTNTYGDNYSSLSTCSSIYMNGDDVLFEYTPAVNESVDIILSNTSSTVTGLFLLDGCPDDPSSNCVASATGSNPAITCQPLTGGTTYFIVVSTWPAPQSVTFDISISLTSASPSCGLNYSHSNVPYNAVNYTTGALHTFPDDRMDAAYTPIGFPFCYDGVLYNDVLISSNGYLTFPGCFSAHPFGTPMVPAVYSPWSITAAAPNTTNAPVNAIMGPWQDIYPSTLAVDGEIRTQLYGAAPNRVFVTKFYDIRMFSCTADDFNGQIAIFETTDNIEIHIGEKTICPGWNVGTAILGLTDFTGTTAVIPAGYNYPTQWSVPTNSPEGHRFTSNCGICTILPVDLINFEGSSFSNYNLLKWETASELNNDYFVLEKSTGGAMFEEVGKIPGHGNSNTLLKYSYKHNNPDEIQYYRLRQVDFDGKWSYSKIISVKSKKTLDINIYPNPAKKDLSFDINESKDATYTVVYSNILGSIHIKEEIIISKGTNSYQMLEFSNLNPGIYFVQILNENNEVIKNQKIVKK